MPADFAAHARHAPGVNSRMPSREARYAFALHLIFMAILPAATSITRPRGDALAAVMLKVVAARFGFKRDEAGLAPAAPGRCAIASRAAAEQAAQMATMN